MLLVSQPAFTQVLSDEFPLAQPYYGLLGGDHRMPELEWGESNGLVVWGARSLLTRGAHAALLNGDGSLVEPYSKRLFTSDRGWPGTSGASWNGENYLVVWSGARDRLYDWNIHAARLSPEGVLLDASPIQVAPGIVDENSPSVAWDGTNHLVVWLEAGNGVRGARVSPEGVVLDQTPLIISNGSVRDSGPEVEWNGASYFVVWSEYNGASGSDIYSARVEPSGVVLDPGGSVITNEDGDQVYPVLAWNGSNFLVVWQDDRGGTTEVIRGALVNSSNEASVPFPVSSPVVMEGKRPDVASDGINFLVAWEQHWEISDDVVAVRVSDDGRVLGQEIDISLLFYSSQTAPSVTWTGTDYLVAWEDSRSSGGYFSAPTNIYSTRVSTSGEVLDHTGHPLSMGLSPQILPSLAGSREGFFAAWTAEREGEWAEIFGTHLESGVVGPGSPSFPVSNTPLDDIWPSVAWDGERYLATWSYFSGDDLSGVYGARVASNGGILDTQTDLSKSGYSEDFKAGSDVACLPGSCLVVYGVGSGGSLVKTDVLALQPQILDLDSELGCSVGSIASGEDEYLALCSASGFRLSVSGEVIGRIPSLSGSNAAWSGSGYFVVWTENDEIRGTRIDPNGVILNPGGIIISAPGCNVAYVDTSWGGSDYLVVWLEEESEDSWNLVVSRVSEDGVVLDAPGILVAQGLDNFSVPAVAGDGSGRWLVGYSRFDHDSEDPGHRIFGRYLSSLHDGVSCSQSDECRSGFCVDGVCCDGPCEGQCEACDLEESPGVCSPVTGQPRGQRPACAGTGACQATCDGMNPDSCTYPGPEVRCAEGICLEGIQYDPAFCDRAGNCPAQDVLPCEPYACGLAECKTTCTTDRDCAGGFFCIDGACDTAPPADDCGCGARDPGSAGIWLVVIMFLGLARRRAS